MSDQPLKFSISDFTGKNISVRRKTVENDYRLHWHRCCEIELVVGGRGSQSLNGSEYELLPGTLYMLTEADCHSVTVYEPLDIINVMFEDKLITKDIYERVLTCETLGLNLETKLVGQSLASVRGFLESLLSEDSRTDLDTSETEFGTMYVSHLIDCILIELLRSCREAEMGIGKSPVGTAILYLHSHYTENVTLDTLAAVTHLSRNYLSEIFSRFTGSTFKSYLIELRLRHACRLLANTDMSVTDICYASGFESFSNFMRTFRSRRNTTPLKFRAENKGGNAQF
ncbi:MAG: AraC family transcriptional regulator [Candidatus Flemingiibacterium sp.]